MEDSSKSDHQPPHFGNEGYQNDVFVQLDDVISSLETCILSWRNLSTEKKRDESETTTFKVPLSTNASSSVIIEDLNQIAPGTFINEDPRNLKSEIQHYKESNAVLRGKLGLTDSELDRSRATLKLFMEEREMLQIKFKRLQDIFQDDELSSPVSPHTSVCSEEEYNATSGSESPIHSKPCQDHELQNVIQYVQSLPLSQSSLTCTSDIHPSNLETEMRRLKGYLDHVKELNGQLSVTLEECKTDSEKLSMHLGKLESTCTALRLALQASERCLKTYSVMLALAEAKGEILLSQATSGDLLNSGWNLLPKDLEIKTKLFMMEVRKSFRIEGSNLESEKRSPEDKAIYRPYAPWLSEEDEQILKDYIQSLKWDLSSVTMLEHSAIDNAHRREVAHCAEIIKAKVNDAIKVSVEASPRLPEKPGRTQIVQELMDTKKRLSELKACLQLLQTEKRALELQCLTQQEHEKAYMLIRDNLKLEQSDWTNREKDSAHNRKDEQKKLTSRERVFQIQSKKSPSSPVMQQLLESLKENSEIKQQVESLMSELDKLAGKVRGQNIQSAQTIKDFFKAHRNLFLTYKNACRKYQEQQHRLESQVVLISQHQCQQIQKLMENIQSQQNKKAERDTGETSL